MVIARVRDRHGKLRASGAFRSSRAHALRLALQTALSLATALLPAGASAAAPDAHFTHITVEQGLSQSTVQVILQDHLGVIWIGTEEGLNRYDGYTFAVCKNDPQDAASLPANIITMLFEDRAPRLWVGTATGLAVFDPRTEAFERMQSIRQRV